MSDQALLAEIRAQREEIAELRVDLQHAVRWMLQQQDRRNLAILMPAVHRLMGMGTWSAATLNARVLASDGADPNLTLLLADYASEGGLRSFGRFLGRCEGVVIGGLRLLDAGEDRDGRLYCVAPPERVSGRLKPARSLPPESAQLDDQSID